MTGKGKGPFYVKKYAPHGYEFQLTNEMDLETGTSSRHSGSTYQSLGELTPPTNPYVPSVSFHSAITAANRNPDYGENPYYNPYYYQGLAEIPFENNSTPEGEEREVSNRPYEDNEPMNVQNPQENEESSDKDHIRAL
ncbi:hypothetical protein L1987_46359 [Smallanthus sonchifolius]|uniref:Uncharacterized protein n=1 Tax=Smallanthus sonchifolius TaxID=185202 RepID=A0ACB9FZH3_9ASTR|nr:hypothetical protein L1987_46359 [Smallanthus sonchifolius]